MAKSAKQKEKLLRIVSILEQKTDDKHYITTKELIEELAKYDIEAERKSIYDDILVLQNMGYDIAQYKGRVGGYSLLSRLFEKSEILPLADAISSSRFITEKKSRELIKKLESFLSEYDAGTLKRNVYVTNRIKSDNESIYYVVDAISSAISEKRKITFQYCDWNMNKEFVPKHDGEYYVVTPMCLSWNDERYYLIAYNGKYKEIRHYRCDKMKNVAVLNDASDKNDITKKFDPVHYENMTFGMYSGEDSAVTLEFPETLCGVMIDRFGKEPTFKKSSNGKISVRVNVKVSPQFFGWLTGLGPDVHIIDPENVVNEYREYLKKVLINY